MPPTTPSAEALAAELMALADEYAEASAADARHYAPGRKAAVRVNLQVEIARLAALSAEPKAQAQAAELVDVTVVLFPDGTNYWTDATAAGQVEAAWGYWKSTKRREQLEVYALVGATGGAVKLRMLREDYARIPATNTSAAIQKAAGEVKHD